MLTCWLNRSASRGRVSRLDKQCRSREYEQEDGREKGHAVADRLEWLSPKEHNHKASEMEPECPDGDDDQDTLTEQLLVECQQLRETVEAQQKLIDK